MAAKLLAGKIEILKESLADLSDATDKQKMQEKITKLQNELTALVLNGPEEKPDVNNDAMIQLYQINQIQMALQKVFRMTVSI